MPLCVFGTVTLDRFMSNANLRPEGEHLFLLCSCWVLSCHSLFNLPPFTATEQPQQPSYWHLHLQWWQQPRFYHRLSCWSRPWIKEYISLQLIKPTCTCQARYWPGDKKIAGCMSTCLIRLCQYRRFCCNPKDALAVYTAQPLASLLQTGCTDDPDVPVCHNRIKSCNDSKVSQCNSFAVFLEEHNLNIFPSFSSAREGHGGLHHHATLICNLNKTINKLFTLLCKGDLFDILIKVKPQLQLLS